MRHTIIVLNAGRSVASQNTHEREGSSVTPRKVTRQERDKSTAATAYEPCVIPQLCTDACIWP